MKYHVSYYYEDGTYDLLLDRSYKSDIEAFKGECNRAMESYKNPNKKNISHFDLFRYIPQRRDYKHILTQCFKENKII